MSHAKMAVTPFLVCKLCLFAFFPQVFLYTLLISNHLVYLLATLHECIACNTDCKLCPFDIFFHIYQTFLYALLLSSRLGYLNET